MLTMLYMLDYTYRFKLQNSYKYEKFFFRRLELKHNFLILSSKTTKKYVNSYIIVVYKIAPLWHICGVTNIRRTCPDSGVI